MRKKISSLRSKSKSSKNKSMAQRSLKERELLKALNRKMELSKKNPKLVEPVGMIASLKKFLCKISCSYSEPILVIAFQLKLN